MDPTGALFTTFLAKETEGSVETSQGGKKKDSHDPALPFPLPWICPRTAAFRPRHRSSDGASPPPPILVVLLTLSSLLSLRTALLAVHEHTSLPFVSRRNHIGDCHDHTVVDSMASSFLCLLRSEALGARAEWRPCSVNPCDGQASLRGARLFIRSGSP